LQNIKKLFEIKKLNALAQEDFNSLKKNIKSLVIHSIQALFVGINSEPIRNVGILQNFMEPDSHNSEIIQYYQTRYGSLLRELLHTPAFRSLQEKQEHLPPPDDFVQNRFINYLPNGDLDLKQDYRLLLATTTENTGLLSILHAGDAPLKESLVKLHGILETCAQFYTLINAIVRLAESGGNLLIYGVMNQEVNDVCSHFLKILELLQQQFTTFSQILEKHYRKANANNQRDSWIKNFFKYRELREIFEKDLTYCRNMIQRILTQVTASTSPLAIEKMRENILCARRYVSGFGVQISGAPELLLLEPSPLPVSEISHAYLIINGRLDSLCQIFDNFEKNPNAGNNAENFALTNWIDRNRDLIFPSTESEIIWFREWFEEQMALIWSPYVSAFIESCCEERHKKVYRRKWLASLLFNPEFARQYSESTPHQCDLQSLMIHYGNVDLIRELIERFIIKLLSLEDEPHFLGSNEAFSLIGAYYRPLEGESLFEGCSGQIKQLIDTAYKWYLSDWRKFQLLLKCILGGGEQEEVFLSLLNNILEVNEETSEEAKKHRLWIFLMLVKEALKNEVNNEKFKNFLFNKKFNLKMLEIPEWARSVVQIELANLQTELLEKPQDFKEAIAIFYLLMGADPTDFSIPDTKGYSFLHALAAGGKFSFIQFLLENEFFNYTPCLSEDSSTLLHSAIMSQDPQMINYFLLRELNLDLSNQKGLTYLHLALLTNQAELAQRLIGAGAKVDVADKDGQTSLHYAVTKTGNLLLIQKIVEKNNLVIDKTDANGKTALHWAVIRNKPLMVKTLLELGANPTKRDFSSSAFLAQNQPGTNRGKTPEDYAQGKSEIKIIFSQYLPPPTQPPTLTNKIWNIFQYKK
jgi:hypothetical protein